MDYSGFSDNDLRLEIEAMELALNAPNSRPFDGSEASGLRYLIRIDFILKG